MKIQDLLKEAQQSKTLISNEKYRISVDMSDGQYPVCYLAILQDNMSVVMNVGLDNLGELSDSANLEDNVKVYYELYSYGKGNQNETVGLYDKNVPKMSGDMLLRLGIDSDGRSANSNQTHDPQNDDMYSFEGWSGVKGITFDSKVSQVLKFVQSRVGVDVTGDLKKILVHVINAHIEDLMNNVEVDDIDFGNDY